MVTLVALAMGLSLLIRIWDLDLTTAKVWWQGPKKWFGSGSALCELLNDFGPTPGALLAAGGAVVGLASIRWKPWRRMGPPALYLVLAYLFGPGLLVNGVLKHTWNRARPKDVAEFGGRQQYEKVFLHHPSSNGRSFPSGHASATFYLCSLGFAAAVWGNRKHVAGLLFVGVVWGALVSWSRVASGAHFLSDVFWSAALVNLVNACVLVAMIPWKRRSDPEMAAGALTRRS